MLVAFLYCKEFVLVLREGCHEIPKKVNKVCRLGTLEGASHSRHPTGLLRFAVFNPLLRWRFFLLAEVKAIVVGRQRYSALSEKKRP